MVAKIKSGKSLIGALNYNENKVKTDKAQLISANGYIKTVEALSFYDKLFRLTDLAERNIRTKTNTVHLSLNFDVNEHLEKERLIMIADEYMKRIGFEYQPYLIYQHFDAGHPHIHIVTTNIQADGKRISLNNIGKLVSEPARQAIEIEFGLVRATDKKNRQADNLDIKPLVYGATDTKRGITNIVNEITKSYRFTSLPELNAILNLYNVTADKGTKESVMFSKGGLRYWAVDKHGQKIGVPIKASSIYAKPTLKLLEDRFRLNDFLRKPFKESLKAKIDKVRSKSISLEQFKNELKKANVLVVVRRNSEGRIYGLSYIDQVNKTIFNGSDLGKNYSAAAIIDSLQYKQAVHVAVPGDQITQKNTPASVNTNQIHTGHGVHSLLAELLDPLDPNATLPDQFGPKKKKKKRRNLNL